MAWYDKLLDALLSIKGADSKFISGLKDLKKAVDGTAKALDISDRALQDGWLAASDEDLEQMHVFAAKLASFAGRVERKTENDWIAESGCNAFSASETTVALRRLLEIRTQLRALRNACDVLKPLVRIQFVKTHMNLKGIAKAFTPSLVALDGMAVKETETDLAAAVSNLDRALVKLQAAIDVVTNLRDTQHQFLIITRSENQARDASRIREAMARPPASPPR